jgi:hypothetical protein
LTPTVFYHEIVLSICLSVYLSVCLHISSVSLP